jgi:integrase
MATLRFWASHFPERQPEHYVFPKERYGAGGDKFAPKAYQTNPTAPIGDIKEAWEAAKFRAARILQGIADGNGEAGADQQKIKPLACRFHDLRHTAVSRMLDAGVPIVKVAKIVGWSPATMVRMAARYGHFALEDLRSAVDSISRTEIQAGPPVFSPVSLSAAGLARPN